MKQTSDRTTYPTYVIMADGTTVDGTLVVYDVHDNAIAAELRIGDDFVRSESTNAAWDTLTDLRRKLESRGMLIGCYGACTNVMPSGMSYNMSGGWRAYRLTLGKHSEETDLVSIWDSAADCTPATIADQEAFYAKWLDSKKR